MVERFVDLALEPHDLACLYFLLTPLLSSVRLIASHVSSLLSLMVPCSTYFFVVHYIGSLSYARNEA